MDKIILPGIGNSGEHHWQTLWESADHDFRRFKPDSWDQPHLNDWCAALERSVNAASSPPLLVAHSLACLLVAHWALRSDSRVRGALLVAVPNPDSPAFPTAAATFAPVPRARLRFPAHIVASEDDPFATVAYTKTVAAAWNVPVTFIGKSGHINGGSGLGDWAQGKQIRAELAAHQET